MASHTLGATRRWLDAWSALARIRPGLTELIGGLTRARADAAAGPVADEEAAVGPANTQRLGGLRAAVRVVASAPRLAAAAPSPVRAGSAETRDLPSVPFARPLTPNPKRHPCSGGPDRRAYETLQRRDKPTA